MAAQQHLVIYHGECPDGFGAAFAAWLKLGDSAEYLPYQYGMVSPDVTDKSVFILDFSFDRQTMEAMDAAAAKVVLLDHHQTNVNAMQGFRCSCGQVHVGPDSRPTAAQLSEHPSGRESLVVLDVTHSGAHLAWEYFHPGAPVPAMIANIEDRDLWTWRYGDAARHYLAHLDELPKDFAVWKGGLCWA